MITASFFKKNGKFQKFRVCGHSGYAESSSDIVCASVSSMTILTINNIEAFGIASTVKTDETDALIELTLIDDDERAHLLIAGLEREFSALADDFPENVRIIVK